MTSRRELLIGAGLAVGGLASLAAGRSMDGAPRDAFDLGKALPRQVGGWRAAAAVDPILAPEDDLARRVYDQVVARRYAAPGQAAITLVVAHGAVQSYATQLHRPELCYPASGFTLSDPAPADLAFGALEVPAAFLDARRGQRADAVLYWTRIGDAYPRDLWEQRLRIARSVFTGRAEDGALVRLSRAAEGGTADRRALARFAQELFAAASPGLRRLLFGAPGSGEVA